MNQQLHGRSLDSEEVRRDDKSHSRFAVVV